MKSDVESRMLATVQEFLWYYCSSVCGSLTAGKRFDFNIIASLLLSVVASPLSLDMEYLFFFFSVGSNIFLSMVVHQLLVILVFLQEKLSAHSSTPQSLLHHLDTIVLKGGKRHKVKIQLKCVFYTKF